MNNKYFKQEVYRDQCKDNAFSYMGKKCQICGFDKPILDIYDFHHIDETTKSFALSEAFGRKGWPKIQEELDKCVMICANCHREVHYLARNSPKDYKKLQEQLWSRKTFYWTDARNKMLVDLYKTDWHLDKVRMHFPSITKSQLAHQVRKLGLKKMVSSTGSKVWTEEELQTLKESPLTDSYRELAQKLPRHTIDSISSKAKDLGLQRYRPDSPITEELKQLVLAERQKGKMFREVSEETGIDYKLVQRIAHTLQKEMTIEERAPYDLLTKEEIRAYTTKNAS